DRVAWVSGWRVNAAMTESDERPLNPDPPRSPGTPELREPSLEVPAVSRDAPTTQDVTEEAGSVEPPD
ncbi:hypothetical protein AB0G02_35370, partial [Actinosynnema sp. NPDC023658]|uniref:hypothetical protein n=1 Tax=Actinosynnema sp. NPDC023658 TaxID=3155465 RepID=UPI0033DFE9E0